MQEIIKWVQKMWFLPVGHSQKNSAPKPSIHWPPFEQWGFSLFPNNVVALQIDTSISQFKPEKRKRRNSEIVKEQVANRPIDLYGI